jgi:hypothetical protein
VVTPKLVVQAARKTTAPAMADGLGATWFPEQTPTRPAPSPTALHTHQRPEINTTSLAVSTILAEI